MEITTRLSWFILALIHMPPALVLFNPDILSRLYGVSLDGEVSVLLVHRGALFLGICLAALFAMFVPEARRLASLLLAISVLSFLVIYAKAGFPDNALRKIAWADLLALAPLLWVLWQSWVR